MSKKNILFVSFDKEYISTIEYKFASLVKEKAQVSFITDRNVFSSFMIMPSKIDILIIPYGTVIEHPEAFSKTKIFYLIDEEREENNPDYIYKFYSVKSIVEKIDKSLIVDSKETGSKGTKVLGVFSAAGGTGTTITALSIAKKLKNKGKRVIYISTTPYQDFAYYMENVEELSVPFSYQCSINIKNALKILVSEIRIKEFDYLPPFKNLPVSYQVGFSTYVQIIDYIKKLNSYDYIVVEMSSELEPGKMEFILRCDKLVAVTTQDRTAVNKLKKSIDSMPDFSDKIVILCNRYKKSQRNFISETDYFKRFEISEYIEEFLEPLDFMNIEKSNLFDVTVLCVE